MTSNFWISCLCLLNTETTVLCHRNLFTELFMWERNAYLVFILFFSKMIFVRKSLSNSCLVVTDLFADMSSPHLLFFKQAFTDCWISKSFGMYNFSACQPVTWGFIWTLFGSLVPSAFSFRFHYHLMLLHALCHVFLCLPLLFSLPTNVFLIPVSGSC